MLLFLVFLVFLSAITLNCYDFTNLVNKILRIKTSLVIFLTLVATFLSHLALT